MADADATDQVDDVDQDYFDAAPEIDEPKSEPKMDIEEEEEASSAALSPNGTTTTTTVADSQQSQHSQHSQNSQPSQPSQESEQQEPQSPESTQSPTDSQSQAKPRPKQSSKQQQQQQHQQQPSFAPYIPPMHQLQRSMSSYSLIMTKQERKKWKQFNKSKQQCLRTLDHYNKTITNNTETDNNTSNHNPFVKEIIEINSVLDDINNVFYRNYGSIMNGFQKTELECTNEWKDEDDVDSNDDDEDEDDDEEESNKPHIDTIGLMNGDIVNLNRLNAFLTNYQTSVHKNLAQFKENLIKIQHTLTPQQKRVKKDAENDDQEKDAEKEKEKAKDSENDSKTEASSDEKSEDKRELTFDENANLFTNDETELTKRELSVERANVQKLKEIILELQSELGKRGGINSRVLHSLNSMQAIKSASRQDIENDNEEKELESENDEGFNCEIVSMEHPGDIYVDAGSTIGWMIKNTGNRIFDKDVKLGFICGDGLLISSYNIPRANINQTVFVKLNFYSFSKPGIYETVFRLTHGAKYFGPSLRVKFRVIAESPGGPYDQPSMKPAPQLRDLKNMPPAQRQAQSQSRSQSQAQRQQQQPQQQQRQQRSQSQLTPQQRQQRQQRHQQYARQRGAAPHASQAAQAQAQAQARVQAHSRAQAAAVAAQQGRSFARPPQAAPRANDRRGGGTGGTPGGPSSQSVQRRASSGNQLLNCLCGQELVLMEVQKAYRGKKVYCDICRKQCKEIVFHCPKGDCKEHRGGFDLCGNCSSVQS